MSNNHAKMCISLVILILVGFGCSYPSKEKRIEELEKQISSLNEEAKVSEPNSEPLTQKENSKSEQTTAAVAVTPPTQINKPKVAPKPLPEPLPVIVPPVVTEKPKVKIECNGVSYVEGSTELLTCQQLEQTKQIEQQKVDTELKIELCKAETEKQRLAYESLINQMTQSNYTKFLNELDITDPCSAYTSVPAITMCLNNHKDTAYDSSIKTRTEALQKGDIIQKNEYIKCLSR